MVCFEPAIIDAANDDDGQNAKHKRIDGREKFQVMHLGLLLMHLLKPVSPSPAQTHNITGAHRMQNGGNPAKRRNLYRAILIVMDRLRSWWVFTA
jgi:hypothetical protein